MLIVLSVGLGGLVLFNLLASLIRAHLLLEMRTVADARMSLDFLEHLVGLPYAFPGLTNMNEITGGTPYGATTLAKGDGSRQPSANELDGARYQGRHVAQIAAKLTHTH